MRNSNPSLCHGCGKEVLWIKTVTGKNMPVDPALLTFVLPSGEITQGHLAHWPTCIKNRGKA